MTLNRDSATWWVILACSVAGFGSTHWELVTAAFPDVSMVWQSRMELLSVFGIFIGGYMRMSPRPLSHDSELAGQGADPTQSLTVTGKQKDG